MSVQPLPRESLVGYVPAKRAPRALRVVAEPTCALCGMSLGPRQLVSHLVSPQTHEQTLLVCCRCGRAARGEGYRPVK